MIRGMSGFPLIQPETASDQLAAVFAETHQVLGLIPNEARAMANSPATLKAYVDVVSALRGGSLPMHLRELIALLVAQENRSDYCLSAHTYTATRVVGLTRFETICARSAQADDPQARAVLTFASSVVRNRGSVSEEELAALRAAGVADGQIVEVIAHVALNVFTNYFNTAARVDIDWPIVRHADIRSPP
jgi:uncharacterized peroxidase-related enzyme